MSSSLDRSAPRSSTPSTVFVPSSPRTTLRASGRVRFFQGLEGGVAGFRDVEFHLVRVGCYGNFTLWTMVRRTLPDTCRAGSFQTGGRRWNDGALAFSVHRLPGRRTATRIATIVRSEPAGTGVEQSDAARAGNEPRFTLASRSRCPPCRTDAGSGARRCGSGSRSSLEKALRPA
jgi:hypothetical protein